MRKILVIDVGGSNVKMMISQEEKRRKFESGPKLTPEEAVKQIKNATSDWAFDAVAIGFPAKAIYAHFGVNSSGELAALFLRGR